MKDFPNPYSQRAIALSTPCHACGYKQGLIIVRFKDDSGFVRCGQCDGALYSVGDRKTGDVSL